MDSSVVLWVISFGRKPPLPILKSASEDCNVFAYDYFHDFVILLRICVCYYLLIVWLPFVHNVNIAEVKFFAHQINAHT